MASCPAQEYSQGETFRNHRPLPTCFEARAKSCRLGQGQSPIHKLSILDQFCTLQTSTYKSCTKSTTVFAEKRSRLPYGRPVSPEFKVIPWTRLTLSGLDLGRACQGLDSRGVPRTSCADHTCDERGSVSRHLEEQGISQSISRSLAVLFTSQIHSVFF